MENALEVKGLTKKYSNFTLDHVNISVKKGSIMGFIGENGAGKSTTIKSILNIIKKESGMIKIYGMDHIDKEIEIKKKLGVVLDECRFHESLTIKMVHSFLKRIYTNWDAVLFKQYLEKFKLPETQRIKEFSRGMKMKLDIAVALSHKPTFLILDEATSGLDPVVRNEILDVFLEFIQDEEHAVFLSSHITSDLEKICDYITFIQKGRIIFSEEKDSILERFGVIRCRQEEYQRLDQTDRLGCRKGSFGYEVLTGNRKQIQKRFPGLTIDPATLDDIMVYYGKEE